MGKLRGRSILCKTIASHGSMHAADSKQSGTPVCERSTVGWTLLPAMAWALCVCLGASSAMAAASPWKNADFVDARLISAVDGTGQLDAVPLGVELRDRKSVV